jgi:outer membrane protein OmpA-like peptidoglycan-associated protein
MQGLWYSKHWAFMTQTRPRMRCRCTGYVWDCFNAEGVSIQPLGVKFAPGDVELSAREESQLDHWAREMIRDPIEKLALVGMVYPDEGEQGPELARRRAEIVRDAFIRRGVQAFVLIAKVEPVSGDGPHPVSRVIFRPILDPPE